MKSDCCSKKQDESFDESSSAAKPCTVVLADTDESIEVEAGLTLLNVGQQAKRLAFECCGLKVPCGRCRVAVMEGEENLSKVTKLETSIRKKLGFLPYERVGCLAKLSGDILIEFK